LDLQTNGGFYEYLAQELRRVEIVSRKYSNTEISIDVKKEIDNLLVELNKLNMVDKGSDEILTCGYFLYAQKN
jgi:hypothetical protein